MKHDVDYYVLLGMLFMFVWWCGYEFARIQYDKPCLAPSITKPTLPAHKAERMQWGRYLSQRGSM